MGQKGSRLPVHQVSVSSLISKDLNTVEINYFEDLFYSLTDEYMLSALTPGFIRVLITSNPNNVKILIKQIFKDFDFFKNNPDVVYFSDIITRIHTLSFLFSILLESSFTDFNSSFFWESEKPFGRELVHMIMYLLFIPLFTSSIITNHSAKVYVRISDSLVVDKRLLWYVFDCVCISVFVTRAHGLGLGKEIPNPMHLILYRSALLRLVLVLNSGILYRSQEDSAIQTNEGSFVVYFYIFFFVILKYL
jgi:hypothetical protein